MTTEAKPAALTAYEKQLEQWSEVEGTISLLRRFVEERKWQFERVPSTSSWGLDKRIKISTSGSSARFIAQLFGRDGWERKTDPYACGSINWHKTIDGVELVIESAEKAQKLIQEVKL